jgi:hypothetical protein
MLAEPEAVTVTAGWEPAAGRAPGDATEPAEAVAAGWETATGRAPGDAAELADAAGAGWETAMLVTAGDAAELADAITADWAAVTAAAAGAGDPGAVSGRNASAAPRAGRPGRSHPVVPGAVSSRASSGVTPYTSTTDPLYRVAPDITMRR